MLQTTVGTYVLNTRPCCACHSRSCCWSISGGGHHLPLLVSTSQMQAEPQRQGWLAGWLGCCQCILLHRFQVRPHPQCQGWSCVLPTCLQPPALLASRPASAATPKASSAHGVELSASAASCWAWSAQAHGPAHTMAWAAALQALSAACEHRAGAGTAGKADRPCP